MVEFEEVSTKTRIAVDGGDIFKLESFVEGPTSPKTSMRNPFAGLIVNSCVHIIYEMKDINDESTIVLPPEAAEAEIADLFSKFDIEWIRENVPFLEEAEIEHSFDEQSRTRLQITIE